MNPVCYAVQHGKLTFVHDRPRYLEERAKMFESWIYTAQVGYLAASGEIKGSHSASGM